MIKLSSKELTDLVDETSSCVVKKSRKQVMSLHASCLVNVKKSVLENLSKTIGKFDQRLDGVILSYSNVKICSVGMIRNDSPDIHYEVEADFFVFRPYIGAVVTGTLHRKCETHLSLIVHKVFNVVIPRPVNPLTLTWSDSNWIGSNFSLGQCVHTKIEFLDLHCPVPYLRGTLDESYDDSVYSEEDESETVIKKKSARKKKLKSGFVDNNTESDNPTDSSINTSKVKRKRKRSAEIAIESETNGSETIKIEADLESYEQDSDCTRKKKCKKKKRYVE